MPSKPIKITLKCRWVDRSDRTYGSTLHTLECQGHEIADIRTSVDGGWICAVLRDEYGIGSYSIDGFTSLSSAKAWVVKRIKEINK